jgi:hypothetical protein
VLGVKGWKGGGGDGRRARRGVVSCINNLGMWFEDVNEMGCISYTRV